LRGVNPLGGGQRADDAVDSSISSRSARLALFLTPAPKGSTVVWPEAKERAGQGAG
jgi:hypothetical protein